MSIIETSCEHLSAPAAIRVGRDLPHDPHDPVDAAAVRRHASVDLAAAAAAAAAAREPSERWFEAGVFWTAAGALLLLISPVGLFVAAQCLVFHVLGLARRRLRADPAARDAAVRRVAWSMIAVAVAIVGIPLFRLVADAVATGRFAGIDRLELLSNFVTLFWFHMFNLYSVLLIGVVVVSGLLAAARPGAARGATFWRPARGAINLMGVNVVAFLGVLAVNWIVLGCPPLIDFMVIVFNREFAG